MSILGTRHQQRNQETMALLATCFQAGFLLGFLLGFFLNPRDGGDMFLRNVG
jgi:hypothetical protein